MNDIRIGRLTLRLSGLSESEGRRLTALITEGLAAAAVPGAAPQAPGALQVSVNAGAEQGLESLSNQIVSEIVSQLVRSA